MRFPPKVAAAALVLAYGPLCAQAPQGTAAQPTAPQPSASQPTTSQPAASPRLSAAVPNRDEVQAAIAKLRLDPNLGQDHKIRTLRWKDSNDPAPPDTPKWLTGLFDYLGRAGRLLMWLAGAILAAFAIVWSFRFFKARSPSVTAVRSAPVSHIGDLDIRPDSLPEDIGAAALELLSAGRVRDALSLLYRGALSRAVHGYGVAILESHTEGEALRAVVARLDTSRAEYFRELVALWQGAVYAGKPAPTAPVAALCSSFAAKLGGPV